MRRPVLILLLVASGATAVDVETAVRTTFVEPWVKAVRTDTPAQLTRFLHPKVRACINDRTRGYFESDQIKPEGLTPQHHITKLAPWNQQGPLISLPADAFTYPVQPTYELDLDDPKSDTLVVTFLAEFKGSWFMVVPCPNEKGMTLYREMAATKKARDGKIATLAGELHDPLRSELKLLVRDGRIVDAAKKYQQTKGLDDVFIAIGVMKAIAK